MDAPVCPACGFENPRAWKACASCGRALGSEVRPVTVTGAMGATERTQVTAAPDFESAPPTAVELSTDEIELEPDDEPNDEPGELPLIGQLDAVDAIQTGVERAFTVGAPTLVALEGGRGSGRTRLLIFASEIGARMADKMRVLYAACRGGRDGQYAPFSRMLLERFGVTPASSPSAVRAQMTTTVRNALQTTDAVEVGQVTHLLGHLAGVPFPDSPFLMPLQDKPEELHTRAIGALCRLIEGDAQSRPVLLLLDDMHHAEDAGWEIVEALTKVQAHLAIVVAGGAPVAERAEQMEPPGGLAIGPIAPLGEADVQAMLHVLLPTLVSAPEPLVAAVTHRTKGNPSAVRELVFALWEAGLFEQTSQGLEVDVQRLESGDLPVTMEDAVQARLARLDAIERATLARASVVGEVFWDGAILGQMRAERTPPGSAEDPLSVWPDDDDAGALNHAIGRLQDKGFVVASESSDLPGATELRFALEGTRELVYDAMDEETRVARHAAVARWLALVGTLRREGVASMIAPHLEKAGQKERAGRAYLEAATFERRSLRIREALRQVELALELLPEEDIVRRIEALHEHGSLLTQVGRNDDAAAAFTQMLQLAWKVGARGKGGAALNRLARVERARGEEERGRVLLHRALELFRAAADLRGVASTLDDLAQIGLLRGEIEEATRFGTEALEIRRAHGDQRGEAVSLTTLGQLQLHAGNLDAAEQLLRLSLDIRQRIGDREGILKTHNGLGVVAFQRGDRAGAVRAWRAALEEAKQMADRRAECFLWNNVGEARLLDGAYDEAVVALERAHELAEGHGDKRALADILRNLAILALKRGDENAGSKMERAFEAAEEYGGTLALGLMHRALGQHRAQTLFDTDGAGAGVAEESFLTSIDLFREAGNEHEAARSLVELAKHLVERGDVEQAKERLREARATFRRMGLTDEAMATDKTLTDLGG